MKTYFLPVILCVTVIASACSVSYEEEKAGLAPEATQYVDPFIGSSFHGHVFVGANVPFGAVQLGPTQLAEGWDWCSGYHYSDSVIIGFAHTHLSGTGIGDLGDILVMPTTGDRKIVKGTRDHLNGGYSSLFSHQEESASAGYYSVVLKRYDIKAELTATERVGFHAYTFPDIDTGHIVIDLKEGIGWDNPIETHIEQLNDSTLVGYRYSKGWADDQRVFFAASFSRPMSSVALFSDTSKVRGPRATGNRIKSVASFNMANDKKLLMKVGISPVSIANAMDNIRAEVPHWDFEKTRADAKAAWNRELGKIEITSASDVRKKIFYTSLYHTMIAPSIFNDRNGEYRGTDKRVYKDTSFTNLTTFSLWDTYRAAHSLYTITQPDRVSDMVTSMLRIYEQQGKLPVWHLMGNETNTMPGNNAFPVIADAILKGVKGIDGHLALEAMKKSVMLNERGLNFVREKGFIPADQELESVAKGLEYSIDDWSAAQVARKLGRQEDYEFFQKRGQHYRNYFDPSTRFVRGRISETKWRTPFSPFISQHRKDDFAEGNAWQYTWLVPHDVEGLIELLGGQKKFTDKLDSLFIIQGDMGEEASSDITGLIGQYAHGNEPSHHITYLYAFVGQPWKTAEKVRYIVDSLYTDKPDGLCGNEDVGQMSSWYVFSTLGFYPVNPANGKYVIGSPVFDKAVLRLTGGRTFTVSTVNNSDKNMYVQSIMLNGKPYTKTFIHYRDIMAGGEMVVTMGGKPGVWGTNKKDWATSSVE
jgi:predicted alpha-1,2-mannosidase